MRSSSAPGFSSCCDTLATSRLEGRRSCRARQSADDGRGRALVFPKLALGLSGFETGVVVMPLVKGDPDDDPDHPIGRIRNTKRLLRTAALIMSVMLIGSSIVTTC